MCDVRIQNDDLILESTIYVEVPKTLKYLKSKSTKMACKAMVFEFQTN